MQWSHVGITIIWDDDIVSEIFMNQSFMKKCQIMLSFELILKDRKMQQTFIIQHSKMEWFLYGNKYEISYHKY